MDESLTAYLLVGLAGLLCLAAAVIIGVVLVMLLRRPPQEGGTQARAPVNLGGQVGPRPVGHGRAANLPAMDDHLSEDELPTVVVSTPPPAPRPAAPEPHRPAALGDSPLSPPPQRRSSGATIIAFDDDEEDDDQ